jgi:ribonuclease HII
MSLGWGIEGEFAGPVFGVDEVGRGPLAGPVLAAAVRLTARAVPDGLGDSKALGEAAREAAAERLRACAGFAIAAASVAEIDRLNIRRATHLAMARAVAALAARHGPPAIVLVDGNDPPRLSCAVEALVGGDARVASIAAASILAKVARDRLMARLAPAWPGYGWEHNRGYGTAAHVEALDRLGPSPHHRHSFAPVRFCRTLSPLGNSRNRLGWSAATSTTCSAGAVPDMELQQFPATG